MLDRKDVQAVTIGTPDHWHVKVAIDALAAGKDVYCEKPLTLTIDESRMICKAVKASGRVFQVGTQQRSEFGNAFLEAVAIARSGRLGKKLKAKASVGTATTGGPFKTEEPPKELDWDFWLGQAPKVPFCPKRIGWDFRWWFDYSGGQVTDWGVHHTDIAFWALGGEKTGVGRGRGQGRVPAGTPVDARLSVGQEVGRRFAQQLQRRRVVRLQHAVAQRQYDQLQQRGQRSAHRRREGPFGRQSRRHPRQVRRGIEEESRRQGLARRRSGQALPRQADAAGHMANFFDCVKDRSLPISDVYSHCNSVNACHMANIAMLLERKVKWDPQKQEFIGDDEANQLTRRKQREPYTIKV